METVSTDLSKLNNVVDNDFVKKLFTKVNDIDIKLTSTAKLVFKTQAD